MSITNDKEFCFLWLSFSFTPPIHFLNTSKTLSELSKTGIKVSMAKCQNIWVSSAYRWWVTLKLEIMLMGGSVKGKKEGTQARNTPEWSEKVSEKLLPSLTFYCL